jgi:hypothetical protein
MKVILAVIVIVSALVAATAWALVGPKPAGAPYVVEVRDVAGVSTLTVAPEVVAAVPGHYMLDEVVVTSNMMPEVVAHAGYAPEVAARLSSGLVN